MSNLLTHPISISVKKNLGLMGITPTSRILVGVSGGVDSMVLVYILHKLGYQVSASHVNFNLRGEESNNDALFVNQWCSDQGISCFELSQDTKAYAASNEVNTQVAARDIRYEWWDYLVHAHSFDVVATAHHLDDTVETVFLNLLRGTGLKGIRGIPHKRDFYIRPLIECSRADIEGFALAHEIPYRTDSSNLTDDYQRNRLRHRLIPLLEELSPGFYSSIRHTLRRVNLEWDAWDHAWQEWQKHQVSAESDGFRIETKDHDIPFLLRWLEEKGIPWNLAHDFVTALSSDSGQMLNFNQFRLSRLEAGFFFEEVQPSIHLIIKHPGHYSFGHFELTIEKVSADQFSRDNNQRIEFVSPEVIKWPLHIRSIKAGDHFQALGMQGKTKKIQDLLVDHKLEMYEKERTLLLSNDDHILWVIGLRLDERAKVKPEDKEIYRLTYKPSE
jgi:tRNA(Ile)-lysidine synthase